jgi:prophage regulatory protein
MKVISRDRLEPEKGINFCPDHLRRMEKKGQFPKPIQLGPGRVAYLESEIDDWLAEKARERQPVMG